MVQEDLTDVLNELPVGSMLLLAMFEGARKMLGHQAVLEPEELKGCGTWGLVQAAWDYQCYAKSSDGFPDLVMPLMGLVRGKVVVSHTTSLAHLELTDDFFTVVMDNTGGKNVLRYVLFPGGGKLVEFDTGNYQCLVGLEPGPEQGYRLIAYDNLLRYFLQDTCYLSAIPSVD